MHGQILALTLLAILLQAHDVRAQTARLTKDAVMQRLEANAGVPSLTSEAGELVAELASYPVIGGEGLIVRIYRQEDVVLARYWPYSFGWRDGFRAMDIQNLAPSPRVTTLTARQFNTLLSDANALVSDPPVRPATSIRQPPCLDGSAVRIRIADANGLRSAFPDGCDRERTQRFVDRMRLAVGRMAPAAFSDQYGPG
jgi:hypothetical protein